MARSNHCLLQRENATRNRLCTSADLYLPYERTSSSRSLKSEHWSDFQDKYGRRSSLSRSSSARGILSYFRSVSWFWFPINGSVWINRAVRFVPALRRVWSLPDRYDDEGGAPLQATPVIHPFEEKDISVSVSVPAHRLERMRIEHCMASWAKRWRLGIALPIECTMH